MKSSYTILIEADYASNNFCAYVPALRMNAVGDTEEETIAIVKELIALELRKSTDLKTYSAKVVSIEVALESPSKDLQAAV